MSLSKSKWFRIKYEKRTHKKYALMYEILQQLPATFTVLQNKARGRGKSGKISSRTLAYRLVEMRELEIITKVGNIYEYMPRVEQGNNELEVPSWREFVEMVLIRDHGKTLRDVTSGKLPQDKEREVQEWETYMVDRDWRLDNASALRVKIILRPSVVKKLDKLRGNAPLSLFVEHILRDWLKEKPLG